MNQEQLTAELINQLSPTDRFKYDKAVAIANIITETATTAMSLLPKAYPRKRIFIKRNRKLVRKRRMEKKQAFHMLLIIPHMRAVDIAIIQAYPPPREFKQGGL